jgi:hypothetical protein
MATSFDTPSAKLLLVNSHTYAIYLIYERFLREILEHLELCENTSTLKSSSAPSPDNTILIPIDLMTRH